MRAYKTNVNFTTKDFYILGATSSRLSTFEYDREKRTHVSYFPSRGTSDTLVVQYVRLTPV